MDALTRRSFFRLGLTVSAAAVGSASDGDKAVMGSPKSFTHAETRLSSEAAATVRVWFKRIGDLQGNAGSAGVLFTARAGREHTPRSRPDAAANASPWGLRPRFGGGLGAAAPGRGPSPRPLAEPDVS